MLFEKYKQFWKTGDIEAFTSIIDPEIEIIMHSTGGVIDPDLWLERITAVVLSDAYAENIRCLGAVRLSSPSISIGLSTFSMRSLRSATR